MEREVQYLHWKMTEHRWLCSNIHLMLETAFKELLVEEVNIHHEAAQVLLHFMAEGEVATRNVEASLPEADIQQEVGFHQEEALAATFRQA